ncbi:hypothetical protein M378DRAFT_32555, partial [Amanita muscaria Koide BX008]
MFSSFLRKRIPEISVFHNPSSPPSIKAVQLLRSAVSNPYPPDTTKPNPPLTFDLTVVESFPTTDQLRTILSYLTPSRTTTTPKSKLASTTFISSHPSSPQLTERPENLHDIAELAKTNSSAVKWPIVVDWAGGKACVGDVECVKALLEGLRRRRDGE